MIFIQNSNGSKILLEDGMNSQEGTQVEITIPLIRLALTGVTGFLGSDVSRAVQSRNIQATALIRASKKEEDFGKEFPSFRKVTGSLLDVHSLHGVMRHQNVFINIAADSSTNVSKENIEGTAEIIRANVIGPALALIVSNQENSQMRKIFISSFDVNKVPAAAKPWVEKATKEIIRYAQEYVDAQGKTSETIDAFSLKMAEDLKKQEFKVFAYPMSKVLMDGVLSQLFEELQAKNMIILRIMGLVGRDMRKSSNSGFLMNLIDAVLDVNERPVGKRITPYKGLTASLISSDDIAEALMNLAKVKLSQEQMKRPLNLELGGDRIAWEEVVRIIAAKAKELEGVDRDFMKNISFIDPPAGFVNVETSADLKPLEQLLQNKTRIIPIRKEIEFLVEQEFLLLRKKISESDEPIVSSAIDDKAAAGNLSLSHKKVLVVDNREVEKETGKGRKFLKDALQDDYAVVEAYDGDSALKIIIEGALILLLQI